MSVVRVYPKAHACSFTRGTGYGTHTAAGVWTDSASGDCAAYCDDLFGAVDETNYATARSSATAAQVNDGRFEWTFGDFPVGFTFGTLRLVAHVRTSNGGGAVIDSSPGVRFFVDPGSGTRDYAAADDTVTTARNRNTEAPGTSQIITRSWASKPGGGAWTRSQLLAGSFKAGLESDSSGSYGTGIDATTGGSSASFDVIAFYVEIDVTPTAATVEPVRTVLSHLLRFFRKPVRQVTITVPLTFGDVEPGDTVWASHSGLPWSPGTRPWEQVPLYVIGVTDNLNEPGRSLTCLDLREAYCTYYSPLRVLGVDDQYTGLARLDMGGGWAVTRAQVAFAQRPGDGLYREVSANAAVLGKDGLLIQGGGDGASSNEDTQYLLHSTYAGGAGDTFTDWTKTVTGSGTVTQDTEDYLIDSAGWQRSAKVATTVSTESAYLSQQIAVGAISPSFYVRQWYKNDSGSDQHFIQIYRVVGGTGNYWNDSTGAWQAGVHNIRPTLTASGVGYFCSKQIPYGASAGTLAVYSGHLNGLQTTANVAHLYATEVLLGTKVLWRRRSLLPTTTAAVTRRQDYTAADNSADFRTWLMERGYFRIDFAPLWDHEDLDDGEDAIVISGAHDGAVGSAAHVCGYHRTNSTTGYWFFNAVQLATSGATLPNAGTAYTLAGRWTSEDEDELGITGQAMDLWVDGTKAAGTTGGTEPVPTTAAKVYLGSDPAYVSFADGYLTNLEIGSRCPTDAEMARF